MAFNLNIPNKIDDFLQVSRETIKSLVQYEELLLKTPNSIFINDARARYRLLRNNNFLLLQ